MNKRIFTTSILLALASSGAVAVAAPAGAATVPSTPETGAVFVATNSPDANAIVAYSRAHDGTLTRLATYRTGGKGGTAVNAPVDSLASQGSLVYDAQHRLLLSVNAGSDSVTVFTVDGTRLHRRQVIGSGGTFPVSIAVHGDVAYVLNGGGNGSLQGFRIRGDHLTWLGGSWRSIGLANTNPPEFLHSPGQVGFSPDGRDLLVTTKAGGTVLDYAVYRYGRLSHTARATTTVSAVPFAFDFDRAGDLVLVQAGGSQLSTYALGADKSVRLLDAGAGDGQKAACWIARSGSTFFVANAGSSDISAYRVTGQGHVRLLGIAATIGGGTGGPIDMAVSSDGTTLYVEDAVHGSIEELAIAHGGRLTRVGTVTGLPAFDGNGIEGIAAT